VHAGRIAVPFGTVAAHDEPGDYLSVRRSDLETRLVPGLWTALGGSLSWFGPSIRVATALTEGLDGSLFSNFQWAGGADQQRFEGAQLDGWAASALVEASPLRGLRTGVSAYTCDVAANRPRDDMKIPARVVLIEAHLEYQEGPIRGRVVGLRGHLDEATELGRRNKTLPNVLATPRTSIGSVAQGLEADFGFDLASPWIAADQTSPFQAWLWAGLHLSDAMAEVEAGTTAHPRAGRRAFTGGLTVQPVDAVSLKVQYTHATLGAGSANPAVDHLTEAGLGLEF
jgi:hypothetical protein